MTLEHTQLDSEKQWNLQNRFVIFEAHVPRATQITERQSTGDTMKQRFLLAMFIAVAISTYLIFVWRTPREADLILINGTIYTLNDEFPIASSIAVRNGRIVDVSATEELAKVYQAKQIIDLAGKTVIPGLIDAHAHLNGFGEMLQSIILVGAKSPEEVAHLVKERAQELQSGDWIYGRGWDQNLWPGKQFPTKALLDATAPNNPVILGRIDGHAIWTNTAAMQLAGVSRETMEPTGGKIYRDSKGEPTGIFVDKAKELIERVFPQPTTEQIERNILLAASECLKMGLTEVQDMGSTEALDVLQRLANEGRLPIRVRAAIDAPSKTWDIWKQRVPFRDVGRGMLTISSVKLYLDGALGSRGAALIEDYSDEPGNRGLTLLGEEQAKTIVTEALRAGYQPCIHAIGDRGNHIALNIFEKVLGSFKPDDYRPRIEHAQVIAPSDIPRFRSLGVLPSMQPAHAISDMFWAEARLGPQRLKGAYAWQSLLKTGIVIPAGSDFPNDVAHPIYGFYAAITRSDPSGYPTDGWQPQEKMTREQALRAYTTWAAYAAFQEHSKGTIEVGKVADLSVLSKDIMKIPYREILETEIEMTIVNGRISYSREATQIP